MTVKDAMAIAAEIFKENKIETPVKEAGVLLAHALKKEVSWIYAHPEYRLDDDNSVKFYDMVNKRSKGMPFQYITNNQEFMSLDFYVNHYCLIPRPETEILVCEALRWINRYCPDRVRVLDIGTGSGAICVSIACYSKKAVIDALDISEKALSVAQVNAKKHNVENRIKFINADFTQWKSEEIYDVIVSNPPYIPHEEIKSLMPGVRDFEPVEALDGGADGLEFYRSIASRAKQLITAEGAIFLEVGMGQAEQVMNMFRKKGFKTSVIKDLAGIDRVVCAYF